MTRPLTLLILAAAAAAHGAASEEPHPGMINERLTVEVDDGVTLRGVLTRPEGSRRPPVIHFVQWLSCDTVLLSPAQQDGWSRMLRRVVRDSGYAVARVDKRGVGGSGGGPCEALDFDTELADHRAVLAALQRREDVDTGRVVLFGASMGSRYAPLMAEGRPGIIGLLIWGGGALTWFERMLAFDRQALELAGTAPDAVNRHMNEHIRLHTEYLLEGRDPPEILRSAPGLAGAWSRMVGTAARSHYGRPFTFHQQAQRADWAAAWSRIPVPVLAVQGAFDWFENRAGGSTIERLATEARFEVIPRMDHHFTLFDTAKDAFADREGRTDPEPFLELALPWLVNLVREVSDEAVGKRQAPRRGA